MKFRHAVFHQMLLALLFVILYAAFCTSCAMLSSYTLLKQNAYVFFSILPVPCACYGQLERASTHLQTATLKIPIYFFVVRGGYESLAFLCVCRISDCASAHVCRLYVLHEQIQTNFGKT